MNISVEAYRGNLDIKRNRATDKALRELFFNVRRIYHKYHSQPFSRINQPLREAFAVYVNAIQDAEVLYCIESISRLNLAAFDQVLAEHYVLQSSISLRNSAEARLKQIVTDHPIHRSGSPAHISQLSEQLRMLLRPLIDDAEHQLGEDVKAGLSRLQVQSAPEVVELEVAPASGMPARSKPGKKGKRINERMLKKIQDDPDSVYWSAAKWSQALDCSKSTIAGTKAWKNCTIAKASSKQDRQELYGHFGNKGKKVVRKQLKERE